MDIVVILGLVLFLVDEVLPFIPEKYVPANGLLHGIVGALRAVFPKPVK